MSWLNLTLPIEWEELGVIATTIAVVVALAANHNSNKQLKKALQMHEQVKSLELLDKRISWVRKIDMDEMPSDLEFSILFSTDVNKHFAKLKELRLKLKSLERDLAIYDDIICEAYDNIDENAPMALIKKAEGKVLFWEFREDKVREFEELCRQYEVTADSMEAEGEIKTYNYKAITDAIRETTQSISDCKKELIGSMSEFIKNSVEPLVKEG